MMFTQLDGHIVLSVTNICKSSHYHGSLNQIWRSPVVLIPPGIVYRQFSFHSGLLLVEAEDAVSDSRLTFVVNFSAHL